MTDIATFQPNAGLQLTSRAPPAPSIPNFINGDSYDPPVEDDDSSTIKCLCGYNEDDGSTVFCERCKTWQHIACYYESSTDVPEIHECIECDTTRKVNPKLAIARQQERMQQIYELNGIVGDKKGKKAATKSHKKKTKDSISAPITNGWTADNIDSSHHDRSSGSPREVPPAKRHKSSHKATTSVAASQTPLLAASRKRAASTAHGAVSPIKSPTTPQETGSAHDTYSAEFLRLFKGPEANDIPANVVDLGLTTDLSTWLEDPDVLAEVTDGCKPKDLFSRLPGSIEELREAAPQINTIIKDDAKSDGSYELHPVWHTLTAGKHVPGGCFVGELRGHIDSQSDYFADPSNRWQTLRHPEPFVFFPPRLPIVIDARHEGSVLRKIRRSCMPNVSLNIFISGDRWYHFGFVSIQEIQADEELTLAWDIPAEFRQALKVAASNGNIARDGIQVVEMSRWVSCVLANFGGCACNLPEADCLLERARASSRNNVSDAVSRNGKTAKGKRGSRKQITPISTGLATNSRANSEIDHRVDQEDDNADIRSASESSRSKQGSRDNTPMTAHSTTDETIGLGIGSERERRKLDHYNRRFEQQKQKEHTEQTGHKRKKRNSAGSAQNTPSATVSKQLGHLEPSPSMSKPRTTLAPRINGVGRSRKEKLMRPAIKPSYVDMATQTEPTEEPAPVIKPIARKAYVSPVHALLQRARDDRLRREQRLAASTNGSSKSSSPASTAISPATKAPSSPSVDLKSSTTSSAPDASDIKEDVDMKDAPPTISDTDIAAPVDMSALAKTESSSSSEIPSIEAPTVETKASDVSETSGKPADLHVELPPVPEFSAGMLTNTPMTATPGSVGSVNISMAQSPGALTVQPPLFSPSVGNPIAPSPVRKTLSLSDYRKRKEKAQAATSITASTGSASPSHDATQATTSGSAEGHSDTTSIADPKDVEMRDTDSIHSLTADPSSPRPPLSHPPPPLFSSAT